jgi:L-threonylcarbamoyladenylate synthase
MTAVDLAGAAAALRRGEVVALPTDTVYGLGVCPLVDGAVDRLYELKQRPSDMPIAVLVDGLEQALSLVELDPIPTRLAERYWPGGLTLVVPGRPGVDLALGGSGATVGTIGVRVPDHEVPRALARETGPLAVTSANLHGGITCTSGDEVRAMFPAGLAVIDGDAPGGIASTVVRVIDGGVEVIREGAVPLAVLLSALTE